VLKYRKLNLLWVVVLLSAMAVAYQNCAQDPFGPGPQQEQASVGDPINGVEILLRDHDIPEIEAGETLVFTVNYQSTGADYYLWYRDLIFASDELLARTDLPEYEIPQFSGDHVGRYYVVVVVNGVESPSDTIDVVLAK
jgi:hypothetical protein